MNTLKTKIQLHLLIVALIIIQGMVVYLSRFAPGQFISLIDNTGLCGILTIIQMMCCFALVAIDWERASFTALLFSGISLVMCSFSILVNRNYSSIPGEVTLIAGILLIVFLRKQLQERDHDANYDILTGIPNRRYCMMELKKIISRKEPFYLLYLDLDGFKQANDKYGHDIGDKILVETANYWRSKMRKEDFLARVGGDEFCAIVPSKGIVDFNSYIARFYEGITKRSIGTSIATAVVNLVDVSIGVVKYPDDCPNGEDILKRVDYAMYEAKKNPSNFCAFNKEIEQQIEHENDVEIYVKSALENKSFYMAYQPQYEAATKKLRGYEALIRLKDKDGNNVPPSEFIPVIEKTGIILDVDDYVIRTTISEFADVVRVNPEIMVSVNISANHICDVNFVDFVAGVINENNFPCENLEMEITEYSYVHSQEIATNTINKLKKMGIKIALDDFGTGYSSLAMFSRLPLDIIKIDKSLIDDIVDNKDKSLLVGQIINIGHMFNYKVLSEGIETEDQLKVLNEHGCDYIQGYYWGKPVTYDDVMAEVKDLIN